MAFSTTSWPDAVSVTASIEPSSNHADAVPVTATTAAATRAELETSRTARSGSARAGPATTRATSSPSHTEAASRWRASAGTARARGSAVQG